MQRNQGDQRVTDIKDLIEWLFAPILAGMIFLGKILHSHGRSLARHETAIALLVNGHEAEQEKRSEQRSEMIATMKTTDGKIDDLSDKFNTLLIELAEQRGAKK